MMNTNYIILLLLNNRVHTTNYSLFLLILFHIWYKENTKQNINRLEHTSLNRNTPEKLSSVLNNRIIRDITHLLDPCKRNSSESLVTTLTPIIHSNDRTPKLLLSLDLDSQRNTQSSQAIQSALEYLTTLFNSTNLH